MSRLRRYLSLGLVMVFLATAVWAQTSPAVGDYGSKANGNWGTAGTWMVCATAGTWAGATNATSAPTQPKNVWILRNTTVTVESSGKTCGNLVIDTNAVIVSNTTQPTSSIVYVRVYGTSFVNNGNIGNPADNLNTLSFEFNNNVTLSGTGVSKLCRLRPLSNATGWTFTFDMDATMTYMGSSGTGGAGILSENGTSNNITFTINAGRTVTCVDQCNVGYNSSQSNDSPTSTTINVNGTLDMSGPNSNLYLRAQSGKTSVLNVNGTLLVGNSFTPSVGTGAIATVTIGATGAMSVGVGGKGTSDFTVAAQTVTGSGAFTLSGGTTINIGAPAGLDPASGPIRTATRTFSPSANYTFITGAAQVTGPDLPSSVGTLTVSDTSGLTLSNSVTVNALNMKRGGLSLNGNTLAFASGGKLSYSDAIAQTTADAEFPSSGGPDTLVVNNAAGLTLHADRTLNGGLYLINGKVTSGSNVLTLGPSAKVVGGSATSFVDGRLIYTLAGPRTLVYPIGNGSDYLPATVTFSAVEGSGDISLELRDTTTTPVGGTVDPRINYLRRYYHAQVGSGLTKMTVDTVTLSYSNADLVGFPYPKNRLQAYAWGTHPSPGWNVWNQAANDTAANRVTVLSPDGGDDIIFAGPIPSPAVAPRLVNFGTIPVSSTVRDSFYVKNTDGFPMTVSGIAKTNPTFTVTPTTATIAAQDSAWFVVTFAPTLPAVATDTLVISHNGLSAKDTVGLVGVGGAPAIVLSSHVLAFGDVKVLTSRMDSISITNPGNDTLRFTGVTCSNADFVITGPDKVAPGATLWGYVTYTPSAMASDTAIVLLSHNAPGGQDTIIATGNGVLSVFGLSTRSLAFGNVLKDSSKVDSVIVINTGNAALAVDSIRSNSALFVSAQTSLNVGAASTVPVYVTFTATSTGAKTGKLFFYHDATTDTVSVSGTGVQAGITIAPTTVAFGGVVTGQPKQDSVVVTNSGTSTLVIDSIRVSTALVVVTPAPAPINAGGSMKFYLTYTPASAGVMTGTVKFYHNAATKVDSVVLSGTGVTGAFFSEDFTPTAGTLLTAMGYVVSSGTASPIAVTSPGLAFANYAASGAGNAATLTTTGQDVYQAFPFINTGSAYLSFMANVTSAATGDYFIALSPTASQTNYYARVHLKSTTGGYLVGISKNNEVGGGAVYGSTVLPIGSTVVITVKYTFVPADTNDQLSVYVFTSSVPTTEPSTPEIANYGTSTKADAGNLGYITLRQGSTGAAPALVIDGIRIATTWSAGVPTSVAETPILVPRVFDLRNNYPNPFNPTTKIEFSVAKDGETSLKVYNMLGQEVATLFNGHAQAGVLHSTVFDAKSLPSGVYFSVLTSEGQRSVKKLMLLK